MKKNTIILCNLQITDKKSTSLKRCALELIYKFTQQVLNYCNSATLTEESEKFMRHFAIAQYDEVLLGFGINLYINPCTFYHGGGRFFQYDSFSSFGKISINAYREQALPLSTQVL